jgi:hypothetical protein
MPCALEDRNQQQMGVLPRETQVKLLLLLLLLLRPP